MKKFSDAKNGNKVWDFIYKWGEVTGTYSDYFSVYFSDYNIESRYYYNGESKDEKGGVRLFWNEKDFGTKDEKPFQLREFLENKLKFKNFDINTKNYFIIYDFEKRKYEFLYNTKKCTLGATYFKSDEQTMKIIIDKLNEEKIEYKEFNIVIEKIIKELKKR